MSPRLVPTIHAHGDATRLDAVLELVAYSARPRPLSVALDELPRRLAKVFDADVCSIYLLEGETLVMRGNVGFPASALSEIRLGVGHGITGLAVEYMRPISLNAASEHSSYQHFPSLGEEKFPIFLALPIVGTEGPLGALVLQRRTPPAFTSQDVELAAALTSPIAALADRARLVDALHGSKRPSARGARRITLSGRSVVPGRALGVLRAFPRPESRSAKDVRGQLSEGAERLDLAIAQAHRALHLLQKESPAQEAAGMRPLQELQTILEDARLKERALELATRRRDTGAGLLDLGLEAQRTAGNLGNEYAMQRATLIADVCEALSVFVDPSWKPDVPPGAVLVGSQFTAFDLLVSMRLRPAAVVLGEHTGDALSKQLLKSIKVPAVVDVAGLFRWSQVGEIALVDGDHGLVRLNPSRAEVATVRYEKKRHGNA